ncbi:hypothetical protein, partial [Burkholderia pseudomultivorans]|uniref:hypothetical protein n=1 Tax=Burkholderia pseudomultivorans TaxID=1207504 RepID=UPI001E56B44B
GKTSQKVNTLSKKLTDLIRNFATAYKASAGTAGPSIAASTERRRHDRGLACSRGMDGRANALRRSGRGGNAGLGTVLPPLGLY